MSEQTDVVIVGAGPAGLATAIALAQRGVDFIILDALPEAQNTSRAAVIHAATLETLGELQVADQLIAQGIKVPHFRVRDRDRILLPVDFTILASATPFALMIPQDETEAILNSRLAELGHQVRRPIKISMIERVNGGARVTCTGSGAESTISTRFVVGADGEKSTVRHGAGIGFPGHTYGSFLLADTHMEWPIPPGEVSLFFAKGGTLVVAPMSQSRFRVVAQLPDAPALPSLADVQKVIDLRGPTRGAKVLDVLWGSRFQVHHRLADRFRDGPILLVGDAAHVHSPAGGQGMNLGLRDAVALGGALHEALRDLDEGPLNRYAVERRASAEIVLSRTDRLTKVATARNAGLRWLRNQALSRASGFEPIRKQAASLLAGYA